MMPAATVETDIVLLGAGHAHVEVLRRFEEAVAALATSDAPAAPAALIALVSLVVMLIGDWLRDRFDVVLRDR